MTWPSRVRVKSQELSSHFESLICKLESMSSHTKLHVFDQDVKVAPGTTFKTERAIGAVHCKNEGMLLRLLGWRCIESAVFACPIHENDHR